MNSDAVLAFWRFTKAELRVAVRRFFMPVRVIAQGVYQIVHESDAVAQDPAATSNARHRSRPG